MSSLNDLRTSLSVLIRRALLAIVLTGCVLHSPSAVGQQRIAPVPVTISVFSGRKDPEFALKEAAHLDELRARLKAAPPYRSAVRGSVIKPVLGYRGIIVNNPNAVLGIPGSLALFNGVIEVRADKVSFLVDKDRALERRLLDLALAAKAIDAKLHAKIRAGW